MSITIVFVNCFAEISNPSSSEVECETTHWANSLNLCLIVSLSRFRAPGLEWHSDRILDCKRDRDILDLGGNGSRSRLWACRENRLRKTAARSLPRRRGYSENGGW